MTNAQTSDIVEQAAAESFEATLNRLVQAIEAAGMTVFATIDHALNARTVGLAMSPTPVLVYGSPKGGTPIMLAAPMTALDLPLRVLVRERDDGIVTIAFHPIAGVLQSAGAPEDAATRLEPAQQMLLKAIAQ